MTELAMKKIAKWFKKIRNKKCDYCGNFTYKLYGDPIYGKCLSCITEEDRLGCYDYREFYDYYF